MTFMLAAGTVESGDVRTMEQRVCVETGSGVLCPEVAAKAIVRAAPSRCSLFLRRNDITGDLVVVSTWSGIMFGSGRSNAASADGTEYDDGPPPFWTPKNPADDDGYDPDDSSDESSQGNTRAPVDKYADLKADLQEKFRQLNTFEQQCKIFRDGDVKRVEHLRHYLDDLKDMEEEKAKYFNLDRLVSLDAHEVLKMIAAMKSRWEKLDIPRITKDLRAALDEMRHQPFGNDRKIPFAEKEKTVQELFDGVMQQPFEPAGTALDIPKGCRWLPAMNLSNGMAAAALWCLVDEHERIQYRAARKDTHFKWYQLVDATFWAGDPKDPAGRIPLEYHCQSKVWSRPEALNVVEALKCEVDTKRLVYRLYTEFCAYGDVGGIVKQARMMQRPPPKAWIWMVFSKLVECGLILEKGSVSSEGVEGWREIVHRDLKPENIFLDTERKDWPQYPQPMLGDFGLAFEAYPDDELNPEIYQGSGTKGYKAPEQDVYMDSETGELLDAYPLYAHTNVWGVGAIIATLVYVQGDVFQRGDEHHRDSPELMGLVGACLENVPQDRPTFAELQEHIDAFIESDGDLQRYMKAARSGVQPDDPFIDLFVGGKCRYQVGMAFGLAKRGLTVRNPDL
ncbi:uncharacterized protein LTR77_004137 [Saxophila tyrrhenica]|uniref:Protein kinase domain-containing protein n=1 Tax=Saxophila tyrrhenica TaxID=1690608 RepID=A0AAV9PFY5_9PEZI|nr:hypothetical protein LTR77_004137 [Saxophila tyrrhenica]